MNIIIIIIVIIVVVILTTLASGFDGELQGYLFSRARLSLSNVSNKLEILNSENFPRKDLVMICMYILFKSVCGGFICYKSISTN